MKDTEQYISQFIENQFPAFYKQEGENFIAFLRAYYEWLEEEGNVLAYTRSLPEIRDIDETLEEFVLHFKEKYLKNIQFNTESNKRLFIKNSLDFYRAKGTSRSVELFFKLIYGVPATIYTPGEDIFRLSDGVWDKPVYLEISSRRDNIKFVGKQITGTTSNAVAYVERLVRRRTFGKYIDVLYISNLTKDFITGEIIRLLDSELGPENPIVIGSFTNALVESGGVEFNIGEEVRFNSNNGSFGRAIVANTSDATGTVEFNLIDGGFGYSNTAEVIVSDSIITISNIVITDPNFQSVEEFRFKHIAQPLANIIYTDAAIDDFNVGDVIESYYGNGDVAANGVILSKTYNQSSQQGEIFVSTQGDLSQDTIFYKMGNSASATIVEFTDKTAEGNVFLISANVILHLNDIAGEFKQGEFLVQYYTPVPGYINAGGYVDNINANGINFTLTDINIGNGVGIFLPGYPIVGTESGATANLYNYGTRIGIKDQVNQFTDLIGNYAFGHETGVTANVDHVTYGSGASFQIGDMINQEVVTINTDLIADYANVALNANTYGFPANLVANLTYGTIESCLETWTGTIGTIASLTAINPGMNYTAPPFVSVYDKKTYPYKRYNQSLRFVNATKAFTPGERIIGQNSLAVGIIMSLDTDTIVSKVASLLKRFEEGEEIVGEFSGAVATLSIVEDMDGQVAGFNALITTNTSISNGVVTDLRVVDSWFGYVNNESVVFYSTENPSKTGRARISVERQGESNGYYRENGGFLSDNKYIHDGEYYQEYSYEVMTALPFDTYIDMFKKVIHVAGTKVFGKCVMEEVSNLEYSIHPSIVQREDLNITFDDVFVVYEGEEFEFSGYGNGGVEPYSIELEGGLPGVNAEMISNTQFIVSGSIANVGIYL